MKWKFDKKYVIPVLVLLAIALVLFLMGAAIGFFTDWKMKQLLALPNDDMGGYTKLFGFPFLVLFLFAGAFFKLTSLGVLIVAGIVAVVLIVYSLYKAWKKS